jgi:hypothetical protein
MTDRKITDRKWGGIAAVKKHRPFAFIFLSPIFLPRSCRAARLAGMVRLVPRIRFSLRTFLVTLLVLSLIGSNLYVSFKWRQAQTDVQRLRDELGYLTIDDPSQLYVRETSRGELLSWRWRIYLPPGQRHLYVATTQIGEEDYTGRAIMPPDPPLGEFTLRAHIERNVLGGWSLVVLYPEGGEEFPIMPLDADWVPDCIPTASRGPLQYAARSPRNFHLEIELAGRAEQTESFAADDRVVLLRLRAATAEQAANHEPCDGAMIWFEKAEPMPNAKSRVKANSAAR